jgi:hypothetical protein
MRAMTTRTIELDRNDLDNSIQALSSVAQALRLTHFEVLSYQALIVSADWIATCVFVLAGNGVLHSSDRAHSQVNSIFGHFAKLTAGSHVRARAKQSAPRAIPKDEGRCFGVAVPFVQ